MTDITRRSGEKTAPGEEAAVDVIVVGGGLAGASPPLQLSTPTSPPKTRPPRWPPTGPRA